MVYHFLFFKYPSQKVPVLEELAGRMENDLKVAKVDTDKYPRLGSRFQIEALPTLILFNKGIFCSYSKISNNCIF